MAYTILSESYGRRLPKITAEADSTEDLTALGTDYAEGSTCNVGGTEYTLDKVSGWIVPGSGGGGGGGALYGPYTLTKKIDQTTGDPEDITVNSGGNITIFPNSLLFYPDDESDPIEVVAPKDTYVGLILAGYRWTPVKKGTVQPVDVTLTSIGNWLYTSSEGVPSYPSLAAYNRAGETVTIRGDTLSIEYYSPVELVPLDSIND